VKVVTGKETNQTKLKRFSKNKTNQFQETRFYESSSLTVCFNSHEHALSSKAWKHPLENNPAIPIANKNKI
jgi:hypothetical protein